MKVFDPKKREFRDKKTNKVVSRPPLAETEPSTAGAPLDEALKETFPASDPPAIIAPHNKPAKSKSDG